MPDHLHLLVEGTAPDSNFRSFMRYLRRRTALEYRRLTLLDLWQDGYFERVLRDGEATATVIAYILENPVRAGLVRHWADYPFLWTIDSAACVSLSRT
jgi:putative transposase